VRRTVIAFAAMLALATAAHAAPPSRPGVVIGSKAFPESWILGELLAERAREAGASPVEHRSNLGGTEIVLQALESGAVDAYPEYTGTIVEVLLKDDPNVPRRDAQGRLDPTALDAALARRGLAATRTLGFNDGYGLAVTRETSQRLGVARISDLGAHPELRYGLTHEFLGRADGWPGLLAHYGLTIPRSNVRGLQHELAWEALRTGAIDVTDVYTTDAWIGALDLVVLADDRAFFPRYDAVVLHRADLAARHPGVVAAWKALEGTIDEPSMIAANAQVVLEKRPVAEAASALLARADSVAGTTPDGAAPATVGVGVRQSLAPLVRHLELVAIALLVSIAIGLPLGILAARSRRLAPLVLGGSGVLQTIPSLALLAFLVPLFGIGVRPALVALFLYGLLPIVRNTYTGLTTIPPTLLEAAHVLGLSPATRLFRVLLPLASPTILAGVRTSAVISVGNATLAALIGAGGLGEPILSGIQLRDSGLILQGALPAAGLALLVELAFNGLQRVVVPRGLRQRERGRSSSAPPAVREDQASGPATGTGSS
jgi:osmoprotectant transport system permease protein